MASESRYLLIVACSQRKREDPGLLPAIDRYDGVNFRVLRKAKREGYWPHNLDVLILSAKYGLVQPDTPIDYYDLRMTRQGALALQRDASTDLDAHLAQTDYRQVFINMGRTYLVALAQSTQMRRQTQKICYATGGIGAKMADMKGWLQSLSS